MTMLIIMNFCRLQLRYGTTWGPRHQGDTWKNPATEVIFDADEYIMGIESNDPNAMFSLLFLTNKRSYGPYGSRNNTGAIIHRRLCPASKRLYYVTGRKGWYYDQLNLFFR